MSDADVVPSLFAKLLYGTDQLSEMSVLELHALSARGLKDIGVARLVKSEPGIWGTPVCVVFPIEDFQLLQAMLREIERRVTEAAAWFDGINAEAAEAAQALRPKGEK